MKKKNNILVDMSLIIFHHGHVRLLKKAAKLGRVIVALTTDKEIIKFKKKKNNFKLQSEKRNCFCN